MRVTVRNPLNGARPARGAFLATLFAIAIVGLVASFGPTAPEVVSVDAGDARSALRLSGDGEQAAAEVYTPEPAGAPGPESEVASASASVAARLPGDLERAMSELDASTGAASQQEPTPQEPEAAPAAPTTEAPTTTVPPTTTTVAGETSDDVDDSQSTTTVEGESGTSEPTDTTDSTATDTSDTTVPEEPSETTAPPATEHPDGWVDAGSGVFVPQIMLDIRYCESRDNYTAANPSSSARGAYQFLTGSWAAYGHAERYGVNQAHLATAAQQDEAALITWQRDGTRPWNASKSCWS